ncbi:MAG: hypothetical protein J6X05_06935 [Bacteroidales bacterium]|nr:hypothetical protein [Bacteroidales bacterium]
MKKIISAIAALMVCAVMMVSCGGAGGNGPYAAEVKTIKDNKDATEVANAIYSIILNYEKANADEIVTAFHAIENIEKNAGKIDESKFKFKGPNDKDNFEMNCLLCWERVKAQDPELFKKENELFIKNLKPEDKESGLKSLDDLIEMGKAMQHMMKVAQ